MNAVPSYTASWGCQPVVKPLQDASRCLFGPVSGIPTHNLQEIGSHRKAKKLLTAAGLVGLAAVSHKSSLPVRVPGDGFKTILPVDWKVWARVLMGISAVHQVNQAFEWKLPPWLGALETLVVVNPLAAGFQVGATLQTVVMAPLVMGVVQGVSAISNRVEAPLKQDWNIPPIVTQVGLTTLGGVGAFFIYPLFYKMVAQTGIIGKELKQQAEKSASAFATATFSTCARGCSPGSFICLGELADIGGSMGLWLKNKFSNNKESKTQAGQS